LPGVVRFREVVPSGAPLGMYEGEFVNCVGLPVQVLASEIPVPLRTGLPARKAAAEKLGQCMARLREARDRNDHAAITEATYRARRADIQLRMADDFGGKTSAGVRAHILAFGDVAMVGCNIEPFCEIGMAIKKRSPFAMTFVCGYTNGRMAYMPTRTEWSKGGYEVENSPFGEDAAETLIEWIVRELCGLRRTSTASPRVEN
jgi:neutral ceramidase